MLYTIDSSGYLTPGLAPVAVCRVYRRQTGPHLIDCPQLGGVSMVSEEEMSLPENGLFLALTWRIQKAGFVGVVVVQWA